MAAIKDEALDEVIGATRDCTVRVDPVRAAELKPRERPASPPNNGRLPLTTDRGMIPTHKSRPQRSLSCVNEEIHVGKARRFGRRSQRRDRWRSMLVCQRRK
jgi:hypothetical protein